jgi:GAF domain-containing protein
MSSHERDLPSLLQTLVERAVALLGAHGGGMYLYDAARGDLELAFVVRDENGQGARVALGEGAAGQVAKTRTPLVIDDYRTWKGHRPNIEDIPFRAVVQVPMLYGGELIGVLDVFEYGDSQRKFSEQDVKLLSLFAAHAASAVHNARLFEKTRRSAIEFARLYETARYMATQQDLGHLLDTIIRRAGALLNAPVSGIYLYDESRNDLYVAVNKGLPASLGVRLAMGEGVAGRVAQTRQLMIIEDHQKWEGRSPKYEGIPIRSVLEVPMLSGGELIGVLTVDEMGDSERKFTEEDAHLLSLFASHAASAIYSARLLENTRHRAEEFKALYEITHDVSLQQDITALLTTIIERATTLLGTLRGGIYLFDPDRGDLVSAVRVGGEIPSGVRLQLGEGAAGRVAQTRQPLIIDDYQTWEGRSSKYEGVPFRAILQVPMLYGGELIGVLSVDEFGADSTRKFTEADARLLSLFASTAASAIYSARLFEQVSLRAGEFEALYQTASDLSSQTNLQSLLNTIIERASILTGASGAALDLFDPGRGDLELVAIRDPDIRPGIHLALGEGLSGRVAQTKQPLVVNDYQHWEDRSPKYEGFPHTSIVGVPMLYSGELIGVLSVFNRAEDARHQHDFTDQDVSLMSLFANAAAGAVYSARLLDQTRSRLEELDALAKVSSALRVASTRAEMMPVILTQLRELLHADGAMFVRLDLGSQDMVVELAQGSLASLVGVILPAGQGLSIEVIRSRQVYVTSDLHSDPHVFQPELLRDVRCAAIAPLLAQDQDMGVIWVTRDQKHGSRPTAFTQSEINLLMAVVDITANAVRRASLYEQTVNYAGRLVTVNAMGHALSQMLDLPAICEKVSRSVLDLLPDTATVFISFFDRRTKLINAVCGLRDGQPVNISALPSTPFDESGGENQSRVILRGRPLIVQDLIESQIASGSVRLDETRWEQEYHTQSAVYVPLQAEGQVIGILQLQSYTKGRYTPADAELLGLVANTAAAAIQNARLFAQLRHRVDQLSALHSVDVAISSTTDLRISLQTVLENITRQLRVDAASVLLLNPATLTLQYIAGEGFLTSQITHASFSLGKGQASAAILDRRIVHIPDLTAPGVEFVRSSLVAAEKFVAYLAAPLIAKGEVKGVLEIFHRAPLDLDEERTSFLEMLAGQAALAIDNALLFEGLERANVELTMAYDATIEGWSQALELRDQETQGHSSRVLELTLRLAAALGLSDKELKDIRQGVLLHDIGKMGIPDSILHKPGPLTDQEWEIMRKHPQYAYDMLAPIVYLRTSLDIPYCHHEKWDGTGYPRALKGETIPIAARIFSVVDVYDALTSDRPYRAAWSREEAIAYILEQSGKHFDPRIVEIFMKVIES